MRRKLAAPGLGQSKNLHTGAQPSMIRRGSKQAMSKKEKEEKEEILPQGKYSMMQFAKDFFRQGHESVEAHASDYGTVKGTMGKLAGWLIVLEASHLIIYIYLANRAGKKKTAVKKAGVEGGLEWSWSELAALVKFSKSPIQVH